MGEVYRARDTKNLSMARVWTSGFREGGFPSMRRLDSQTVDTSLRSTRYHVHDVSGERETIIAVWLRRRVATRL